VIGGGPAGSLAAALAADAGLETVILERKRYPRPKICGGFISARCLSLLPETLALSLQKDFEAVRSIKVIRGERQFIFNAEKSLGLIVKREDFDRRLAAYSSSRGASLIENVFLNRISPARAVNTGKPIYLLQQGGGDAEPIRARYVIGADGALGSSALLSGLRKKRDKKTGWAFSNIAAVDSGKAQPGLLNFYPLPFRGGMGWAFCGPGWVNRGVGGLAGRDLLLKSYYRLFPEDRGRVKPGAWPLPFLGPLKKTADRNLLLVGDAAGVIDPFSGEGLYSSMICSILAVTSIKKAESSAKPAGELYQEQFNSYFRRNFAASLAGAFLLHARAVAVPSSLPGAMADLCANRLWFNRSPGNFIY
jgi:flavin-dependent dehydrogenase